MSPEFATLEIHTNLLTAHISRGLLRSENIPAFIANEHYLGIDWPLMVALGGMRLQVPVVFADDARAVLARRQTGEFELALQEIAPHPKPTCSKCGGSDLQAITPWSSKSIVILAYFVGGAIFPPLRIEQCRACHGTEMEERE